MSLNALTRQAMALLRHHHRSLLVLYLTFTGLSIAVITPLVTAALSALRPLTGDAAITTGGLLEFLTSAGGALWLLITVLFTALLIILQQASITLIAAQPKDHSLRATTRALWGLADAFQHWQPWPPCRPQPILCWPCPLSQGSELPGICC